MSGQFASRLKGTETVSQTWHKLSLRASIATIGLLATAFIGVETPKAAGAARNSCLNSPASRQKACFAGVYNLQLSNDVGASLILDDDGQFEWFYLAPAGRKSAKGRWTITNGAIMLTSVQLNPNLPVFELTSFAAWDDVAETRLRLNLRNAELEKAERLCPVFVGDALQDYQPPPAPPLSPPIPSPAATKEAEDRLVQSRAAKKAYEDSVAAAVNAPLAQKQRLKLIAEQAQNDWQQAEMRRAWRYQEAGVELPSLGPLHLPDVCTVSPMAYDVPESGWKRGIAISIENVSDDYLISNISARLTFASGKTVNLTSNQSGQAFVPHDPREQLTQVTLSVAAPLRRMRAFKLDQPAAQGVVNLTVNGELLNPPPFQTLRLRPVGRSLVSAGFLAGRYVPEPSSN